MTDADPVRANTESSLGSLTWSARLLRSPAGCLNCLPTGFLFRSCAHPSSLAQTPTRVGGAARAPPALGKLYCVRASQTSFVARELRYQCGSPTCAPLQRESWQARELLCRSMLLCSAGSPRWPDQNEREDSQR
jgi:hypothetical protein